ncbi:MAG: hypothetical protein IH594_09525, partial [Bacteroidales bacterium]|nr:hypothetical protein [Bacteroidales bacterium]
MKKSILIQLLFIAWVNCLSQSVITTIDQVIYDMAGEPFRSGSWYPWGKHEGLLEDGNTSFSGYDWYEGARPGTWMQGVTSGQYKGINTWGQAYPEKGYISGGGTLDFRIQIRNLFLFAYRNGKWDTIVHTPTPNVTTGWSNYSYGFAGTSKTSNARGEASNGGGISITMVPDKIIHWWDNYWPRAPMPHDAEAVMSYAEIRLIHNNDTTIDLNKVKVLAAQGLDTYTKIDEVSSGAPIASGGIPRHKYITPEWKSFTMYMVGNPPATTLDTYKTQVLSNPPPPRVVMGGYPAGSVVSPVNGSSFIKGDEVTVEILATDDNGSVSKVEIYLNELLVEVINDFPYKYAIADIQPGTYSVQAKIFDNENNQITTNVVEFTVTASIPPVINIHKPFNGEVFNGSSFDVEIEAVASDSDGVVQLVEIFNNGTLIGSVSEEPFSVIWEGVTEGIYEIYGIAHDDSDTKTVSEKIFFVVGDCTGSKTYITNAELNNELSGWGLWNNPGNKSTM